MAVSISTARRIASEVWTLSTPAVEAFARGTRIPDDESIAILTREVDAHLDTDDRDVQRLLVWVLGEAQRRGL